MPSDADKTRRWLHDIMDHIDAAESFIENIDFETFEKDLMRFHAATRCLEIISEAARRLPDLLKLRHPYISWREIAAAGNIYRHTRFAN